MAGLYRRTRMEILFQGNVIAVVLGVQQITALCFIYPVLPEIQII